MDRRKTIPIYTTRGDIGALMVYPYLFNAQGEWVGFITASKEVYSVLGHYVGYLGEGPRILRKRVYSFDKPRLTPLPAPPVLRVPNTLPLAPLMPELPFSVIDVLEDAPDQLPTLDAGELRQDLD